MALRLGALHDALLHPGNAELAKHAAEEVAAYDSRLTRIEGRLTLLTWLLGIAIALNLAQTWLLLTILARLDR